MKKGKVYKKDRRYAPSKDRWRFIRIAAIAKAIKEPLRGNQTTEKQRILLDEVQAFIEKKLEEYGNKRKNVADY